MKWWLGLVAWLQLARLLNCLKCPDLPLKFEHELCMCDVPRNGGSGWQKSCLKFDRSSPFDSSNHYYLLTYYIKNRLEFDCNYNGNIKYVPDMFANVTDAHFQRMWFMKCPLPEISIREIIGKFNITKLRFYSNNENKTSISENFLYGMKGLKELQLEHSEIETIPKNFFKDNFELRSISLTHNNLKSLPESLFKHTKDLINLNLGANDIQTLPENIFENLTQLNKLHLYNNNLSVLPKKIFSGLNVATLELRNNKLTELAPRMFENMKFLSRVGLAGNKFKTLPSELFLNSTNISVLDISKTRFSSLPGNLLKGLDRLESLAMDDCNMTEFHDDYFSHAPNLQSLKLYNNRLSDISPLLLSRNSKLKLLKLDVNDLTAIKAHMFKNQFLLQQLSLRGNKIREVEPGSFKDLIKLKTLNLDHNKIMSLSNDLFYMTQGITKLDLSYNQIKGDLRSHFMYLAKLQMLLLNKNNLTTVPFVQNLVGLKRVDLRYNKINVLEPVTDVAQSVTYKFQYNNISAINMHYIDFLSRIQENKDGDDLSKFPFPSVYEISYNPVMCDCNITNFIVYSKKLSLKYVGKVPIIFEIDNLECAGPAAMKGHKVIELDPDEPVCLIDEDCPRNCTCQLRSSNQTTTVKCKNMALTSLPLKIPFNTSTVDYSNNNITGHDLLTLTEAIYENVSHLYLSHNQITYFPKEYLPRKLKMLDLRFNSLKSMPDWLPGYSKHHNADYYFGNNSFPCNCSARDFKIWLAENHKRVLDIENVYCMFGTVKKSPLNMTDSELCPAGEEPKDFLIAAIVTVSVVSILMMALAVLYYKQRQNVIVFLFTHNMCQFFFKEEDLDEDKVFDAFISYSYHNRDFVMDHLVPELEHKDPKYNLCIHERNFMPGKSIVENIINAIELSRRVVIILSNEFVESDWGMLEFAVAHHQMLKDCINRVVIVMMDEVISDKAKSVKELQFFLQTKTYLKKDELWFWDKLRYALPRRPLQLKNKDGPLLVLPNIDQQKKLKPKIEEVRVEINDKIAKKLDEDKTISSIETLEKRLEGLMNPICNDGMFGDKPAIQMEPRGMKQQQLITAAPAYRENFI